MKMRIDIISFRDSGKEDAVASPMYIVKYKKNWYSRWRYITDIDTGGPKLFTEQEWQALVCILADM